MLQPQISSSKKQGQIFDHLLHMGKLDFNCKSDV